MAIYFVGDIQGCFSELSLLLEQVKFNKKKDELWVAGDMVARGTQSLETLRFIISLGSSAKVVLGNHDLHLLATYHKIKKEKTKDHLIDILNAPDVESIMQWLANQPLIQKIDNEEVYMSHAGLTPQWSPATALKQAQKAQKHLSSKKRIKWLKSMYGETPNSWEKAETEIEKFRFTINSLTRMRFCYKDGSLDFEHKSTPKSSPENLKPWFSFPDHLKGVHWIFGHWASLLGNCSNPNAFALDTGCVWGNHLTLLRWHDKQLFTQKYLHHIHKSS